MSVKSQNATRITVQEQRDILTGSIRRSMNYDYGTGCLYREVILESAERYQVCPFELSLDLAVWVDTLICDYNYVFDPMSA